MHFIVDLLCDVSVVYAAAAAASCAWFSYQWFTTPAVAARENSADALTRQRSTGLPDKMPPPTEVRDVLAAAALAPLHATITVLWEAVAPAGEGPKTESLRPMTTTAAVKARANDMGLYTMKSLYLQTLGVE